MSRYIVVGAYNDQGAEGIVAGDQIVSPQWNLCAIASELIW